MTMLKAMRGGMFTGVKKQPWFIALVFLVATTTTLGQALPPGVSPAMLSQLKSMSPAQQQALAKQVDFRRGAMAAFNAPESLQMNDKKWLEIIKMHE